MSDYNILIGGAAGQGMDTISNNIEKILHKLGYYLLSTKNYESRVRGGHNYIQIRFSSHPIYSHSNKFDFIIALNDEIIQNHKHKLKTNGIILCDNSTTYTDDNIFSYHINNTAKSLGNILMSNTVFLGMFVKMFNLNLDIALNVLSSSFKGEKLELNKKALEAGYNISKNIITLPNVDRKGSMLINGNKSLALGSISAGCTFFSSYPMTPATSIMTYLSTKQNHTGMVVEQAEDEIGAINMAVGASVAGVRSMTATSGGGLALMTETLSFLGVSETPLVVVNVQRPGPATGLPTRTEQSDLSFVLTAGHGEFPRMIISLRDTEDCFYQTARAFNLAEKYQIPVLILSDEYLADCNITTPVFDSSMVTIDRYLANPSEIQNYKRYELSENGVSPRLIPGKSNHLVLTDSHEHLENGHITEDPIIRINMVKKRDKKLETLINNDIHEPNYFGSKSPEILLIGWGSTQGALRETVHTLTSEGVNIGALVFGDIYPLPTKLLYKYSNIANYIINIEQNYSGQLSKLISQETQITMDKSLYKYDGRQLNHEDILEFLRKEVL
jgi:2-oxoglutarate/2-oxoacid ferredoxin oxidoreductase subunit alpha